MHALLAFAKPKSYPKAPGDFQLDVGWLLLAVVACLALWVWSRRDTIRRGLLGLEDPRIYALLRFGLGWLLIQSFWNLYPHWRMLWSDEGMFLIDAARSRYGGTALSGWTRDEGFLDAWAILRYFWGKHSLFLIHGTPQFVHGYMLVFFGVLATYAVGFRSRTSGVLAWLMTLDVYDRTSLYSEGTDSVFRCLFFIMIFAHTGGAWSIDNWIRVRRAKAHFAESEAAGRRLFDRRRLYDHMLTWAWVSGWVIAFCVVVDYALVGPAMLSALGLAWVVLESWIHHRVELRHPDTRQRSGVPSVVRYPLVHRWPRVLIMFQWGAIYTTTGIVKTGSVWARGDALYYALNMDHFYRFEDWTQQISSLFALGLFRIFTWITHYWEISFPLVLIGCYHLFREHNRDTHWARAEAARRVETWLGRVALIVAYFVVYRITVVVFPFCLALPKKGADPVDPTAGLQIIHYAFALVVPLVIGLWVGLAYRPLTLFRGGFRWKRLALPEIVIDGPFLRRWLLGRRTWIGVGAIFHGKLIAFMNIGMFPFIMIHGYLAFFATRDLRAVALWLLAHIDRRRNGDAKFWRLVGGLVSVRLADRIRYYLVEEQRPEDEAPRPYFIARPDVWFGSSTQVDQRGPAFSRSWVSFFMLTLTGLVGIRIFRNDIAHMLRPENGPVSYITWLDDAMLAWWLAILGVAVVSCFRRTPDAPAAGAEQPRVGVPLLRSPLLRVVALTIMLVHMGAVFVKLAPSFPVFTRARSGVSGLTGDWMRVSHTSQSWRMFAPNPPRSNSFMQTVIIEADGDQWDLRNNSLHNRPFPFIVNDRLRKMQRRMIGKGKWYLSHWIKFQCREWTLKHGQRPQTVIVNKLWTRIPKPEVSYFRGPYVPSKLKVRRKEVKRMDCGPTFEPPAFMKRRFGMEVTEDDLKDEQRREDKMRRRDERTKRSWERRVNFGGPTKQKPRTPPPTKAPAKPAVAKD